MIGDLPRNEWQLQKLLTKHWLSDGLVLDGEPLFLAAWEVMSDYRINDSKRHFGLPSVDFVLIDCDGHMVMAELKMRVRTPRDAWHVLCQVTHRAVVLGEAFVDAKLEAAYLDCRSGTDGRAVADVKVGSLLDAHADFFQRRPLERLAGVPVRRVVMALEFGSCYRKVAAVFAAGGPEAHAAIGAYAQGIEFKRFKALPPRPWLSVDLTPTRAFTVDPNTGKAARA